MQGDSTSTDSLPFADERGAEISGDGQYRYLLWRRWSNGPWATFIMLNPSTADADNDDPTIRRCIGFAQAWKMGGIRVVNLYPFRATKPADLWQASVPEGYGNEHWIRDAIDPHGISIAAWGTHGKEDRIRIVRNIFADLGVVLYALNITKGGQPGHPLYLPKTAEPVEFYPPLGPDSPSYASSAQSQEVGGND